MRAEQYTAATQLAQIIIVTGLQPEFGQTFHFLAVVNDVTKAKKRTILEFALCCRNGSGNTKTETTIIVNRD